MYFQWVLETYDIKSLSYTMQLGGIKVALVQLGGMKETYAFVHGKYNII